MPPAAPATATVFLPSRWLVRLGYRRWASTLLTLLRRFREDHLALTAGGLTFTTLISVVPLFTVMLALFSSFPMFASLQGSLQLYFQQTLLPDTIAQPILGWLAQFSSRAGRLGVAGLVALVFTALAMMLTIDRALNAIWRVRKQRPIAQRVLVYWAAVTLGPLLFGVSLAATSYAVSASRGILGDMPRGFGFTVGVIEFVVESVGIASLYHYVPNVHVRWRDALLGGVFVATGLSLLKHAITYYFGAVPTYSMIYGAFSAVPTLLVWIYLSWIIVLLGAVVAAYSPLVGKKMTRLGDVPGTDFRLALMILAELARARGEGQGGLDASSLSARIGIDPLQIDRVVEGLVELGLVGKLAEAGAGRHVLVCDPRSALAEPLVTRFLLEPAPDLGAVWQRAGFAEMKLAEIMPA